MAKSPSHKYGQLIGNMLEEMFTPIFQNIADNNKLFLDYVGRSRTARKGKKVSWDDAYGSKHDLDFVLEFEGSEHNIGRPAAFVESAWRRYTKHSKNKVQEIQAAVLPIAEKYKSENPFLGAILAGEFTSPSLAQINSAGFEVIYIEYKTICKAFQAAGIDATFEEDTPESELNEKVQSILSLTNGDLVSIKEKILKDIAPQISSFEEKLISKITKQIKKIIISPLYSKRCEFADLNEAKKFIQHFDEKNSENGNVFYKYEIIVEYMNGDEVRGSFTDRNKAINLLDSVLSD